MLLLLLLLGGRVLQRGRQREVRAGGWDAVAELGWGVLTAQGGCRLF